MINIFKPETKKSRMKKEFLRKLFHLSILFIPLFIKYLDKIFNNQKITLIVFLSLTIFVFIIDFFNLIFKFGSIKNTKLLRYIGRNWEIKRYKISGSSWVMIFTSIVLILNIEKFLIKTSLVVLAVSDSLAAIFGVAFGKTKFFKKSLEGFIVFFISTLIISFFCIKDEPFSKLILISLLTAFAELFSKPLKMDDNFLVPFTYVLFFKIL